MQEGHFSSQEAKPERRVVFIGGLDDGRKAVEVLQSNPRVNLVGAFVLDEEEGKKVSGFLTFDDLVRPPVLRKIKRIKNHIEDIRKLNPDLVFVVGFSQLIPKSLIDIPPMGVIGFHSAILPGRRGCAPLIWAIIDGIKETGVSMFYMDEGIDTGDVIGVEKFSIEDTDYASDILHKANSATIKLLKIYLEDLLYGTAPRLKQDDSLCTYTPKRGPADGEIDWSKPAKDIVNLIRALAPPYPMAHTFGGDLVPIFIEKARLAEGVELPPPRYARRSQQPQRVLCIAAHHDDEVLGVGGTLALHSQSGAKVIALILSEGEEQKLVDTPKCSGRRGCAYNAAKVLGIEAICHDFPDQQMDVVPFIDIVKILEAIIQEFQPTIVYTHHRGDANTDHQIVFKATYAACRPMSKSGSSVQRLLTYETPSSTDQAPQVGDFLFNPTTFVNIEPVWGKKVEALKYYPQELIGGKHPRSLEYIEALARFRGGHSGFVLAEAFVPVRERIVAFQF